MVRLEIIPLIFDFIICEQLSSGNFKRVSHTVYCVYIVSVCIVYVQVEKEIFDKMDYLFSNGQGDGEYNELFVDM